MPYGDGAKLQGRLVAYLPNGQVQGTLSHPISWQVSVPFNDVGSLEIAYHRDAPNFDLLFQNGLEVSVQIRYWDSTLGDFDFWFEPPGCRFLLVKYAFNDASRDAPYQFTLPNYAWLLRKVRQIDILKFEGDSGQRLYLSNAGKPLSDLILESQARGNVPNMGIGFSNTVDSSGAAWNVNSSIGMGFEVGQDALSMLDTLAKQRFCDWSFQGNTLNIYNPNGYLTQDVTGSVKLIARHDAIDTPTTYSIEDVAVKLFNQGDNGKSKVDTYSRSTNWGQWEEAMTSSGISTLEGLSVISQKELKSKFDTKSEYTYQLVFGEGSPMPFIHYRPGYLITTSGSAGARVQQITLIKEGDHAELQGNVVLTNDPDVNRGVPRELRQQRYLNSLVGGTGLGGPVGTGGNGMFNSARLMPPNPNASPEPAGVTDVVAVDGPVFNALGDPSAQVMLSWTPVTFDTDALALTPAAYEIEVQNVLYPNDRPIQLSVSGDTAQARVIVDDIGTYNYKVRAVSKQGVLGAYSTSASIALTWPSVTLPTPSTPLPLARSNQIRVQWDGNDNAGSSVSFPYIRFLMVERSSTSATTGFGSLGSLNVQRNSRDERMNDTLNDGVNVWYRFRFRDSTGAFGPYSAVAAATSVGPAFGDIPPNSIPGSAIMDQTITGQQIAQNTIQGQHVASYSLYDVNMTRGFGTRNLIRDPNLSYPLVFPRLDYSNLAANTNARCQWTVSGAPAGTVLSILGAGGEYDARFIFALNNLWPDPTPGVASQALPNVDYGIPVDPDFGPLYAGFRLRAVSDNWTGGSITIQMYGRFYVYDGTAIGGTAVRLLASSTVTANTAGTYVLIKTPSPGVNMITGPAEAPGSLIDASYLLPYIRVTSTGMSGKPNTGVFVSRPFLMQSYTAI